MKVFEFHFNPKLKENLIFDSFCYEAGNIYEKRVGNLYMVGLLKNVLPQNLRFLDRLAKVIKEKFYNLVLSSPEKSLKESLKMANEYLEQIAKKGDVSWLGNLNFAVLSIKNFELNFTKVGDLKIILLRSGGVIDIDKKLKFQEITPWPLKIFGNIVSGKLIKDDVILVLNKDIFSILGGNEQHAVPRKQTKNGELFRSSSLLDKIAQIFPFDEKKLKEILKSKNEELLKATGIFLLINITEEISPKKKETILPAPKEFSFKEVFSPFVLLFQSSKKIGKNIVKKIHLPVLIAGGKAKILKFPSFSSFKFKLPEISFSKIKSLLKRQPAESDDESTEESYYESPAPQEPPIIAKPPIAEPPIIKKIKVNEIKEQPVAKKIFVLPKLALPKLVLPKLALPKLTLSKLALNKKMIMVPALILVLIIGFFIASTEEKNQTKKYEAQITAIQERINQANSYLILKSDSRAQEKANVIFKEVLGELSSLSKISSTLSKNVSEEVSLLKKYVSDNLFELSKMTEISEPKLLFEFSSKEYVPQQLVSDGKNVYVFSSYNQGFFQITPDGDKISIPNEKKFNLAAYSDNSIYLFSKDSSAASKPNQITVLKNNEIISSSSLQLPSSQYNFNDLAAFKSNLYFLDQKSGEIIKYDYSSGDDSSQLWLYSKTKKSTDSKSIAIDGSVWVLNKDNSINRYHGGWFQEEISINVFPEAKELSKLIIVPGLPYLYILEPSQKRIIILDKNGKIFQQFQSEKFDMLLDFSVSQNGKTIWFLNGQKIYQIEI